MFENIALLSVTAAAANPALPTARGSNCKVTAHGATGVYDVTLDFAVTQAECVEQLTLRGSNPHLNGNVEHVSDPVQRVRVGIAGTPSDAVPFSLVIFRLPSGHP
jgi:hypothetical protein